MERELKTVGAATTVQEQGEERAEDSWSLSVTLHGGGTSSCLLWFKNFE